MIFALAGNQNCGKTTLFNQLTGSNQHVGNFPGVTVDQKSGPVRGQKDCTVVDLPGIYSLRPYTAEEIVTRDFILKNKPDGIINIVDATNLERNLYLTLQLLTLRVPTVLALNMMDELTGNGGSIDTDKLSQQLGVPVVPICAASGDGVEALIETAVRTAERRQLPSVIDFCPPGPVHRCIHAVCHQIEDHAQRAGLSVRFAATWVIDGDEAVTEQLQLDQNEKELIEHSIVQMEQERGLDRNAAIADMRYTFIEALVKSCVVKPHESKERTRSVRADRILTGKYTAIPIFIGVMLLIFYLTFHVIGQGLSDLLAAGIDALCGAVHDLLKMRRLHVVMGMVCDKEYEYCVHRMARQADAFYACTTNAAERSLGEQTIASLAEQECGEVYDCRSTEHALELALDHASPTDCILVCGSLFLTGEAEKILRGRPKTTD